MADDGKNGRPSNDGNKRPAGDRGGRREGAAGRQGDDRSARRGGSARGARSDGQRRSQRRTDRPFDASRPPTQPDPPTDPDVTGRELDDEVRTELSTLSGGAAGAVARHLVMAGRLLDDDPELAYQHTLAARRRASRIGVVREAAGIAAYTAGRYAEALAELRAARRITGSAEYLPMMADSERGLGRPRRALDLAADPAVAGLDPAGRIEMLIVAAGARRDLGQLEAAAVSLQVPELRSRSGQPWVARLRYAYADALLALGRSTEAREWFVRAAQVDHDGQTDALDRIDELDARIPGKG
jgi:tetratricopeptide (TPR) repeat protein